MVSWSLIHFSHVLTIILKCLMCAGTMKFHYNKYNFITPTGLLYRDFNVCGTQCSLNVYITIHNFTKIHLFKWK